MECEWGVDNGHWYAGALRLCSRVQVYYTKQSDWADLLSYRSLVKLLGGNSSFNIVLIYL